MLINYSVYGFKVFCNEINFTMLSNKKIKNKDYILKKNDIEVVKSSVIYGQNNTGKSTFIESIKILKDIIAKEMIDDKISDNLINYNLFSDLNKEIITFKIEFLYENNIYDYLLSFKYKGGIINECLKVNKNEIFDRSKEKQKNQKLQPIIDLIKNYNNKLVISILPSEYVKYSKDIKNFFNKIIILTEEKFMFWEGMDGVYEYLTLVTDEEREKFNKIINAADISIDEIKIDTTKEQDEKFKKFNLLSFHSMKNQRYYLPTLAIDSSGSKRFMIYIVEILKIMKQGGILIIDEIDNSLHTLLVKNIIILFNNIENKNSQLIMTSHDLLLLDSKSLFRKDQIWFTYKDRDEMYFYSLDDFKNNIDDGIRNNTMINYLKGMFGALPNPDIESVFFDE